MAAKAEAVEQKTEPVPAEATQQQALEQVRPLAAALPANAIAVLNADPDLVCDTAHFAEGELRAREQDIREQLPKTDFAGLFSLRTLALALLWAMSLWRRVQPAEKTLRAKLPRMFQLRRAMLSTLESAVALELLPQKAYDDIAAGTGPLDAAQDLADLCGHFRTEVLAGRTLVTPAMVEEADALAVEVRGLLRPSGASKRPATPEETAAADLRDRVWTLLGQRYEKARQAAVVVWGTRAADRHVPPLGSRRVVRAKAPPSGSGTAAPE